MVDSTTEAVRAFLNGAGVSIERMGLETRPFSEGVFERLVEGGYSVGCLETRSRWELLKFRINKTDRNDARGAPTRFW